MCSTNQLTTSWLNNNILIIILVSELITGQATKLEHVKINNG